MEEIEKSKKYRQKLHDLYVDDIEERLWEEDNDLAIDVLTFVLGSRIAIRMIYDEGKCPVFKSEAIKESKKIQKEIFDMIMLLGTEECEEIESEQKEIDLQYATSGNDIRFKDMTPIRKRRKKC